MRIDGMVRREEAPAESEAPVTVEREPREDEYSGAHRPASASELRVILPALRGDYVTSAREFARASGCTVAVSLEIDVSLAWLKGTGASGVYFAPDGEIGLVWAHAGGVTSQPLGLSDAVQVAIFNGGPELLDGTFSQDGISVGELVGVSGARIMDAEGEVVGFAASAGLTLGFWPVEYFYQRGVGGHEAL